MITQEESAVTVAILHGTFGFPCSDEPSAFPLSRHLLCLNHSMNEHR